MTQDEIIEMARDSGMELYGLGKDRARFVHHLVAFANLVAAKALAQTQEPVAWTLADKVRQDLDRQSCPDAFMRIAVESIVKHHPPQRTWVGLTDEDEIPWDGVDAKSFARAIEAKLKELNT